MAKRFLWFGILVMVLGLSGCVMMGALAYSSQAREDARVEDGRGGIIRVFNTTDHATGSRYWVVGPSRDGTYTRSQILGLTSGSGRSFTVDVDGSYLIYYRAASSDEGANPPRDENYQSWRSKQVYISNNITVRVEIP